MTLRRGAVTLLAFAALLGLGACADQPAPTLREPAAIERSVDESPAISGPGFRSRGSLDSHYAKHGREFGRITKQEYLALAQQLRDAPVGGDILEIVREADRVVTRFDKSRGHFGAYNRDRTIRTFFVPNDGVNYFRRQARRAH